MKHRTIAVLVLIAVAAVCAFGYVAAFSNLSGGYPSLSDRVWRPGRPLTRDARSVATYERAVQEYLAAADAYIQAAQNDINTIGREMNAAGYAMVAVQREYQEFMAAR